VPFLVALSATAATFIAGLTVLAPVALEAASTLTFATAKLITIAIASAKLTSVAAAEFVPIASAKLTSVAPAEFVPLTSAELVTLAFPATITLAAAEFIATAEIFPTAEFFATAALASAQHAEHGKPTLLAVVEALVERVGSISQFLQCSTGFRQDLRTPTQALGRIQVIAPLPVAARSNECIDALEA